MMVNPKIFVFLTLLLTFFNMYILKSSYIKAGFLTMIIVILFYIVYIGYKQKKRYSILEEELDPEEFIRRSKEAYKHAGKDKELNSLYNLDLAFAYLSLGEFDKLIEALFKVDTKYLPKINKSILVYYNALMIGYHEIGEMDKVEEVYRKAEAYKDKEKLEDSLILLIKSNKSLYDKNYKASREFLSTYLEKNNKNISKRLELEILFDLGFIDEKEGNIEDARLKYEEVAKKASKLHIGKKAREALKSLENL